ncbi:MAG: hypothetical protein IPL45_12405 [Actinomycetales bacterium]|nr:hypothetical protein [Actinomycetales bacterium]
MITTGETTVSATRVVDASAATVGRCATAIGTADQTGAVAASSIMVRDSVGGSCLGAGGFGPDGRTAAPTNG